MARIPISLPRRWSVGIRSRNSISCSSAMEF
jgi:hypothetical protein